MSGVKGMRRRQAVSSFQRGVLAQRASAAARELCINLMQDDESDPGFADRVELVAGVIRRHLGLEVAS